MGDELSHGQAKVDTHTDRHTHTDVGNDNTRRPKGPRVKMSDHKVQHLCSCFSQRRGCWQRLELCMASRETKRTVFPPFFPSVLNYTSRSINMLLPTPRLINLVN